MNRQERRRLERQGSPAKYIYDKDRQEVFEQGVHHGIAITYKTVLSIVAYSIRLEFGLGKTRLSRCMKRICDNIISFTEGYLSPTDLPLIEEENRQHGFDINEVDKKLR